MRGRIAIVEWIRMACHARTCLQEVHACDRRMLKGPPGPYLSSGAGFRRFGESKHLFSSHKSTGHGGGRSPPPFPVCSREGSDPAASTKPGPGTEINSGRTPGWMHVHLHRGLCDGDRQNHRVGLDIDIQNTARPHLMDCASYPTPKERSGKAAGVEVSWQSVPWLGFPIIGF